MKGLIAYIYRNGRDSSNGGISSRVDSVVVLGGPEIFEPGADRPAVKLVRRQFGSGVYIHAEPVDKPAGDLVGPMFGGTYISSCDSRWRDLVGHSYPIPLHDRWETPEQYRMLSI